MTIRRGWGPALLAAALAVGVISTAQAVAKRLGKTGVVVGNCFGFVGNRMLYAYGRENQFMLLEGATPAQIDDALQRFGMAMGPNAVGDLAGLDVGYQIRRARTDLPDDPRYYRVADLLVENGRLGQKTGKGAYRYDAKTRARSEDPEAVALIRAEAKRLGVPQREIGAEEIVNRCLYALINEGAKLSLAWRLDSQACRNRVVVPSGSGGNTWAHDSYARRQLSGFSQSLRDWPCWHPRDQLGDGSRRGTSRSAFARSAMARPG